MPTVTGTLIALDRERVSLAAGHQVLSLATLGEPVPASLRLGDEVAGWRRGVHVRELRLARVRTDTGRVDAGPDEDTIRTGLRTWDLHAGGWLAPRPGGPGLRVCHDGRLALWIADAEGDVWLPPAAARDCDDSVKGPGLLRHTRLMLRR
jgi:hypothetical protein